MHKILCIADHYLPGYKAGGPIRSLLNLVSWLGDEFQFRIIAFDRDLGDNVSYPGVETGIWIEQDKVDVMYITPRHRRLLSLRRLLDEQDYDLLYINSFFSSLSIQTMALSRFNTLPATPVVLAPRGELSQGAISLKHAKKQLYLRFARTLKLYQGVIWQASSKFEYQDILRALDHLTPKHSPTIMIAPNLPTVIIDGLSTTHQPVKQTGCLKLIFLSRITRKKNLDYALRVLKDIKGDIQFDIFGPVEDMIYWNECQALIRSLPPNVRALYHGPLAAAHAKESFRGYHAFFFPTRAENFGHVILEALSSGCPVLVSDQTPWQNLAADNAGWELPLSYPERFLVKLSELVAMDQTTWLSWSHGAKQLAKSFINNPKVIEANRKLFLHALDNFH